MPGRFVDLRGMSYVNRLSEYFAEMDAIAKTDPVGVIKLRNEHLKPFLKSKDTGSVFSDTPINGFSSCMFLNKECPPLPLDDQYTGGFTCINGKVYDDCGNQIDLGDDLDDGEFPLHFD